MADLIRAAQNQFRELQREYNTFCEKELNPWILSHPTASGMITAVAIGATVAAVASMGPVGLLAAIPLILVAAKIVSVAARNSETFGKMFKLEWTGTKDKKGLKERGVNSDRIGILQHKDIPNVPLIFVLAVLQEGKGKEFRKTYMDKFLALESAATTGDHARDAATAVMHGDLSRAGQSAKKAVQTAGQAATSGARTTGNKLARFFGLGGNDEIDSSSDDAEEEDVSNSRN